MEKKEMKKETGRQSRLRVSEPSGSATNARKTTASGLLDFARYIFAIPGSEDNYRLAYVNSLLAKGVPACFCAHLAGRRCFERIIIENENKSRK